MHKRISRAILHLSWHSLVVVIVLLAMTLSLIWLTQSSIDDLRPKIVGWVNTDAEYPLQVEKMSIEWKGIIPYLKLSDIAILQGDTDKTLTQFDSATLNLDVLESLLRWKVTIGQMTINGIEISLIHHQNGRIDLLGSAHNETSDNNEFGHWLLEQQHLKLINSRLVWHEESPSLDLQEPFVLSGLTLDLLNDEDQHQIMGQAKLDNLSGDLSFALTLDGDPQGNDWDSVMSIKADKLQITPLLQDKLIQHVPKKLHRAFTNVSTHFSVNVDTIWRKAKLATFNGQFELENQGLGDKISSTLQASRGPAGDWDINLPEVMLTESNQTSPVFTGQLSISEHSSLSAPIVTTKIAEIDIASLIAFLPETLNQTLSPYKAQGKLTDIHLSYNATEQSQKVTSHGNFSSLAISPHSGIAAITNLSGKFQANSDSLNIDMHGQDVAVIQNITTGQNTTEQKIFTLDKFVSSIKWNKADQDWLLSIPQFLIVDQNFEFQLSGNVKSTVDQSPEFDLQGQFIRANLVELSSMIPDFLLTPPTREWLDMAILGGYLKSGHLIFNGPLDKFPFDHEEGQFEIYLDMADATLNYEEGWPKIEDINTELLINGRVLTITSPQGRILNASLPETIVSIPDLGVDDRHLLIKGKALGELNDGLTYIQNSPLKTGIGEKIQYLTLKGAMDLDLDIDIPLFDEESTVKGELHLKDNQVALKELDINLKKVSGDFIFNQDQWGGENLKALLFGDPIDIKIDIKDDGQAISENNTSEITLSSKADKNTIKDRLTQVGIQPDQLKFLEFIHGETTWQARLLLPSTPGDPAEKTGLMITSNLLGMHIDAPAPIGKKASEQRPLMINTTLSAQAPESISFEYNNMIKGDILLTQSAEVTKLDRLALHFGAGPVTLPQIENNIIWADGKLDKLDITPWPDFIDQNFESDSKVTLPPAENNIALNISIDEFTIADQTFTDNHFQIDSGSEKWEIQIENNDVQGALLIPYNLTEQAITGKFKRLKLTTSDNNTTQPVIDLDPTKLPSLRLKADIFELNKLQLGKLQLHAVHADNGLVIDNLTLSSPEFQLYASGEWSRVANTSGKAISSRSKFLIKADGPALGPLLEKFDYGVVGIEGGETSIDIDSNWPGSPADFDLTKARATLNLEVKDGRFTEIKNRVGKIFGLLSIQSIGRRLSLDFNDLFKKGFTFDKIQGKFDIDRGNAYTNNLSMTGPSAQIDVTGRIGLTTEDYDQLVTVIPSVADSLPMASALFGPVGAGVGAAILLAGKVFTKIPDTIDQVLKNQYTLTGSWEEPVLTPLVTKQKQNNTSIHRQK